jgi:hypothetical protein
VGQEKKVGVDEGWVVHGPDEIGIYNFQRDYPYLSEGEVKRERREKEFSGWGGFGSYIKDGEGKPIEGLMVALAGAGNPNSFEISNSDHDNFLIQIKNHLGQFVPSGRFSSHGLERYRRTGRDDGMEAHIFDNGEEHTIKITNRRDGGVKEYSVRLGRTAPKEGSYPTGAAWEDGYGHVIPNSQLEIRKVK